MLIALLSGLLAACGENQGDRPVPVRQEKIVRTAELTIAGATDMVALVNGLARRYEELHDGVVVRVVTLEAAKTLRDLRTGTLAIGMVSRRLAQGESDLVGFPIARDGIGIVIAASPNPANFDRDRLAAALAAPGTRGLRVYERGERVVSLLRNKFGLEIMPGARLPEVRDDSALPAAIMAHVRGGVALPLAEAQDLVARYPAALRLAAVNGYSPSERNVRRGHYPLLQPLMLVTRDLPEGEARSFINFCLSPQAIDLVRQSGLIAYVD